jgi:hypothetical protein
LEGIYHGDGGDDELGRVMENSRRIFQNLETQKEIFDRRTWMMKKKKKMMMMTKQGPTS